MEPSEVIRRAWEIVQESGVPESLHGVAFTEAVSLIAGPGRPIGRSDVSGRNDSARGDTGSTSEGGKRGTIDTDDALMKFAAEAGIDAAELMDVFYFDPDGTPHMNVPARKLGGTTTARAKAVATAITAAYYFAEDDTQVEIEKIRAECERLKCYDGKNFINHLTSAAGIVLSGSGNARVARAKSSEIEAALRVVVNLARGAKD
jgi:hypothetical protein